MKLNYYTDKNGDKVLIPKGFTVSSVASEQTIDNGLVVIDSYGNEFVWIPVETEFKRGSNEKYPMYFDEDEQEMLDDVEYTQMYDVDDMVASVNKYNGFFVGRYETSYDNTNKRVESVKNADSYSHTSWDDLFEKQASLYPASGSAEVVSGMMTGKQWDTIVSWMQGDPNYNKGYFDYRNEFLQEDVDSFGGIYEYLDATFAAESWTYTSINTGSVEEYKIKNIYDMAGNYAEYTIEGDDYNCQTQKARGFLTLNDGILPTWDVWTSVGATSRLVLYIK